MPNSPHLSVVPLIHGKTTIRGHRGITLSRGHVHPEEHMRWGRHILSCRNSQLHIHSAAF